MIKKKDDYRFDDLLSDIRSDSRNRNIPIHTYTQHTQHSSLTVVPFFFSLLKILINVRTIYEIAK